MLALFDWAENFGQNGLAREVEWDLPSDQNDPAAGATNHAPASALLQWKCPRGTVFRPLKS